MVGAVPGVIFREIQPEHDVLEDREKAIRDVLDRRHAAGKHLFAAANARSEHDVDDVRLDEAGHVRHQRGVVLVVGVQHHDDLGVGLERQPVARFLVSAVSPIHGVTVHLDAEPARNVNRLVHARIVHENDVVACAARQPIERGLQRLGGVIRGQDDADGKILDFRKMIRQLREYTSIIFALSAPPAEQIW